MRAITNDDIFRYEDFVVQDNFKFGDDKEIVRIVCFCSPLYSPSRIQIVALQNNVLAVNKKQLRRPTRASIATPTKNIRSRSSIVNAPY